MKPRRHRSWRCSSAGIAHAEDKAAAERYFRAGAKAYAAQNFAAAATDFDEAYKALPLPEIAFSAAQAYRRLYRVEPKPEYVRRAVELYRAYLDKVKTGGRVGDAADNLAEMERELDKLEASGDRRLDGAARSSTRGSASASRSPIKRAARDTTRAARDRRRAGDAHQGPHRDARRQADRAVRAGRCRRARST